MYAVIDATGDLAGRRILDAGAGTGVLTETLRLRSEHPASVVLLDSSRAMLARQGTTSPSSVTSSTADYPEDPEGMPEPVTDNPLNELLVVVGLALLAIGVASRMLKRLLLTNVLVAMVVGVVLGPEVFGVFQPQVDEEDRRFLEQVARVTLAIALMGVGLQVTRADLRRCLRPTVVLLTLGMVSMWLLTSAGAWLLLDLPIGGALLLGAVLTPTDPAVASTLVTGPLAEKLLPREVRRTLQLESGANDGLALPFVLLAGVVAMDGPDASFGGWARSAGTEVALGLLLGALLGLVAGKIVERSIHAHEIESPNLIGIGLALAAVALGGVHLLGGSGVLAVFIAALAFSFVLEEHVREELEEAQEALAQFFVIPAFILFGMLLPWETWKALGATGLLFAAWVLLLRRPVIIAPLLALTGTSRRDAAFVGWFGPLGIAAIYYAVFAERYNLPYYSSLYGAATLAIAISVLVHSLTATPGARLLGRRTPFGTLRRPWSVESEDAP